jgi:hypothetical protein
MRAELLQQLIYLEAHRLHDILTLYLPAETLLAILGLPRTHRVDMDHEAFYGRPIRSTTRHSHAYEETALHITQFGCQGFTTVTLRLFSVARKIH